MSFFLVLAWECFDDRWRRLEAFAGSSVLVSFVTRFQVSCGESSPSSFHLRLEMWWDDTRGFPSREKLRGKELTLSGITRLLTGEIIKNANFDTGYGLKVQFLLFRQSYYLSESKIMLQIRNHAKKGNKKWLIALNSEAIL